MSRDRMNAGSYNHDEYMQSSGWPPTGLRGVPTSQVIHAPQASGSASGATSLNPAAGGFGFTHNRAHPSSAIGMPLSPHIVDDRQFFGMTPASHACYSSFNSSDVESVGITGVNSDYRDRSSVSSPSTSVSSYGPSSSKAEVETVASSIIPDRSVRDVRKRAYDHATRLDNVAKKAGEDMEANLSVLAFSARPDTKEHSNNTPRMYVSPMFAEAFKQRGIADLKAFLTSVAYDTRSREELPTSELVVKLRQEVSDLTESLSSQHRDMQCLEIEISRLKEENDRLRRFAEGHLVVSSKLQEAAQLSYEYSSYYNIQSNGTS
ncbi:hypothetical protein BXZ70DRAFT_505179 [Cristinia sonorae]|uniref:Uncharacterized protein n=1 Tax=Cristinia sonorae TaxID=1940300 RepID=A0A8K0UUW4_9AGAR|nr:hypothetical protein BXZ70DRAFT_505179 [Cristinia sonorae]